MPAASSLEVIAEAGGMVIRDRITPSKMEVPFALRLDNVRRIVTMTYDPMRVRPAMPFADHTTDRKVLIEQIGDYIYRYYDGLADQLSLDKLMPGDLVRGAERDEFIMQLLHDAQVKISFGLEDSVFVELFCPTSEADALLYCAHLFVRLTSTRRTPDDLN